MSPEPVHIRDERIGVVSAETVPNPRLVQQIASETGGAIGGTLRSDVLSGPESQAAADVTMMCHNSRRCGPRWETEGRRAAKRDPVSGDRPVANRDCPTMSGPWR